MSSPPPRDVDTGEEVDLTGEVSVIRLRDVAGGDAISQILSEPGAVVVVDLSEVGSLSVQSTLSTLVRALTELKRQGRELFLVAAPAELLSLIDYVEYRELFDVYDTVPEAMAQAERIRIDLRGGS